MKRLPLLLVAGLLACVAHAPPPMTQESLEAFLHREVKGSQGGGGLIEFAYDGVRMACVSDAEHDRMRLVAPILRESEVTETQRKLMLAANYHTALDTRYATSRGIVFAAFLHPISTLDEDTIRSGLRQVASLARTFGSTYTSGELTFGIP